jgi:hypothetical protein
MTKKPLPPEPIYLAHPVVGDATGLDADQIAALVKSNLARAGRWVAWLVTNTEDVAIRCSWLGYIMNLPETPTMRERGLRDDDSEAATCTGIVLCGGRLSSGMKRGAKTLLEVGAKNERVFTQATQLVYEAGRRDPVDKDHYSLLCDARDELDKRRKRYVLDLLELGDEPPAWTPQDSRAFLADSLRVARATGYSGRSSVEAILGIAQVIK